MKQLKTSSNGLASDTTYHILPTTNTVYVYEYVGSHDYSGMYYSEEENSGGSQAQFPRDRSIRQDAQMAYSVSNRSSALLLSNTELCGFIGFCKSSAYSSCLNITIRSCNQCGTFAAVSFLIWLLCLGMATLIGNSIVLAVGVHRRRTGKLKKLDILRSSLALADFISGIQVMVISVYSYSWSMNLTALELNKQQLALRGSASAFIGATFYMFGYTSSVYHLLYISMQRLYAVKKPLMFKRQGKSTVYNGIGVIWLLAIVSATLPAWFPKDFTFSYVVPAFLYLPVVRDFSQTPDYSLAISLVIFLFAIPYLITAAATLACGILVCKEQRNKTRSLSETSRYSKDSQKNLIRRNKTAFVTVGTMVVGFTITLIPILIVTALLYANQLDCSTYSTPYLICIYLSMSNNFVNIIIYSLKDKSFRLSAKALFSALST